MKTEKMLAEITDPDLELLKDLDGKMSRDGKIIQLKKKGFAWPKIGYIFEIGGEAARQAAISAAREIERRKKLRLIEKSPNPQEMIILMPLEDVLSARTAHLLSSVNEWSKKKYKKVGDLPDKCELDLRKYRGFGDATVREIKDLLARFSLPPLKSE